MVVLFTIAILLNVLGGEVEKYSRRKLLFGMLVGLTVNLLILFWLMIKEVSSEVLYFIFYLTVGVLSCLAWPTCLYVLSIPYPLDSLTIFQFNQCNCPIDVELGVSVRGLRGLPHHSDRTGD